MQLDIRDAKPDDAGAIARILNAIIAARVYAAFDTLVSIEVEREYIDGCPTRGVLHVAVSRAENRIVGFQSMEPFATYTHAFDHVGVLGTYVDLDCRLQGIASQLFRATFESALQKGYEKIFTFVRADNPAALQTYLRQGFRTVGIASRQAKFGSEYVDEIIIERLLTR